MSLDSIIRESTRVVTVSVKLFLYPLETCLSEITGLLITIVLFGFFLFEGCSSSILFQNYGLSAYQQFRLRSMTNDQALNAKLPASSAGSLQLFRAGCEIESYSISGFFLSSDGSYISSMPLKRVESDGFALNTSVAADIILALEGSNNGDDWSFIGQTSDFRKTSTGVRFFGESSNIEWRQQTYDLRVPWPLIATSSVTSIVFACGFGGLALLRCIGRTHRARPFFCLVCLALASINFVAGLAFIAQGLPRECFYPLWICAVFVALG